MTIYPNKFQSFAKRAEGGLSIFVPPGLLSGGTDGTAPGAVTTANIKELVYNRYSAGIGPDAPNQTKSATVWVRLGSTMKRFVGVKFGQADFQVNKGQPLVVNLSAMAFGAHMVSTFNFAAPTFWTSAVYGGDHATLRIGDDSIASGTMVNPTAVNNADNLNFSINNKLDDDPHRLWASPYPRRMYNRDREVTGSIEADYLGSTEYQRFVDGTLSSLDVVVARKISTTTYSVTMTFPRIRYDSHTGANARGQKDEIVKQNMGFKALGGISGVHSDPREIRWD
ncbi:MAG: phage tail tube protein [Nanoarchaeota archaeon]